MIFSERYRQDNNLWIPNEEYNFQYSDGDENENYILKAIQQSNDLSIGSEDLSAYIKDWPSLYHLSPKRADLLRPLAEQLKDKKILEIGSGCGAITRFLGEINCDVLALEGSLRRARITLERCRGLDNVKVVSDNFDAFVTEEKFDCITLIGVLEYSNLFIKGDNPPLAMLNKAKQLLKPGGHIIIAIENKLGLKYWAGAPEDHVSKAYHGIQNLYSDEETKTFGHHEMVSLLMQAGFGISNFMYPFPDYKFGDIIITDAGFKKEGFDPLGLLFEKFDYFQNTRYDSQFSSTLTAQSLFYNKLLPYFANSFLITATFSQSVQSHKENQILAYVYSTSRKRKYCKQTVFSSDSESGSVSVTRQRLYESNSKSSFCLQHVLQDESYINGQILFSSLLPIVSANGWTLEDITRWARTFYDVVISRSFQKDQRAWLTGNFLDLAPFNIIFDSGKPHFFDLEWVCDEDIPAYYVFFRGIVYSLGRMFFVNNPQPGTPLQILQLAIEITGHYFHFGNAELLDCQTREIKYFSAVALREITEPFAATELNVRGSGYLELLGANKELLLHNGKLKEEYEVLESANEKSQTYITELTEQLENAKVSSDLLMNELEQARQDSEIYKKYLDWYKNTFEDRSLPGVIKEKLKSKFKKFYINLIDSQLRKESIQNKYAVSYSLNYIKENGLKHSIAKAAEKVRKEGFKGISRSALRQKAIKKLAVIEKQEISKAMPNIPPIDTEAIQKSITGLKYTPKISIVFPTYNIKPSLLELAIQSVKNQLYGNWELCIADDCSTKRETIEVLKRYQNESNIKIVFLDKNSGISEASNAAISLSTGEYIALMDHDDEIPPDALFWVVNELNQYPDTDIIYSDECKIDEAGILSDYFYKPDWSPELLMNMMYTGHLTVYNKNFLIKKVGLFRKEYDFSQDYDLMLRAVENTDKIRHIPKFLYYWRITEGSAAQGDKPYARVTNLAALADAGKRRGLEGEIFEFPVANRLKMKVQGEKKVSLIIPTDSYTNLKETIESILDSTTYLNYEIVPVTNSKLAMQMKEIFSYDNISYCNYDKPFNFSDKCNAGALHATGEIVIFFNDDVRPLQDDWIENTIEFFEIPEIGGISPKLLYENDTIQYAGMITGVRNLTGTSFHCHHKDATLYLNYPQLVRDVSILSGACMAMRKGLFLRLGGFDILNTPVGHSDVDLSFRILEAGYRCVYTPYATLRHVGHLSLKEHEKEEQNKSKKDKADIFLIKRWIKYLDKDKYFPVGMRDLLYIDSPEPYQLYKPNKEQIGGEKGDVILVSHDLSLSGAPIMLYDTAKVLTEQGYFVIVFCPADGPLRKMYQDAGIPVIIDELVLQQHHTFERFAKNFDYIICNTVVTWPVVKQMQHIVKTIWWIQEGQTIQYFTHDDEFVNTIRHAQHLVGVSDYNISFVKPYNNKITKIHNACYDLDDHSVRASDNNKEKIIFTLVGSIERRKGHDVLVEALEAIDTALLKKAEVWFIGRTLKEQYLNGILPRIDSLGVIKMLGERSHDECLELMKQSDVILNISRDDPFPVVLVEAMCMGKTCVVSTNSGLAEMIENGQNGFVFQNEDSADLTQKLSVILQNKADLEVIGKKARKTYKQHLTIEVFSDKLEKYMQKIEEAELV